MATTCKLIAKVSLGSDAATIDFTSIPSTYTDLLLLCHLRGTNGSVNGFQNTSVLRFNNNSGANYSYRSVAGNGASASSGSDSGATSLYIGAISGSGNTASTFSSLAFYIPNYAGSTNKSLSFESFGETNASTAYTQAFAGLWSQTTAINEINIIAGSTHSFVTNSSAYLYGILKA